MTVRGNGAAPTRDRTWGWRLAIGAPGYLLCDVAALWLCVHGLGRGVPGAPLLVAYLLGYLASTIPIPGGLGVLDGGLAAALVAYHGPAATALGGVLIYHPLALGSPPCRGRSHSSRPRERGFLPARSRRRRSGDEVRIPFQRTWDEPRARAGTSR